MCLTADCSRSLRIWAAWVRITFALFSAAEVALVFCLFIGPDCPAANVADFPVFVLVALKQILVSERTLACWIYLEVVFQHTSSCHFTPFVKELFKGQC